MFTICPILNMKNLEKFIHGLFDVEKSAGNIDKIHIKLRMEIPESEDSWKKIEG